MDNTCYTIRKVKLWLTHNLSYNCVKIKAMVRLSHNLRERVAGMTQTDMGVPVAGDYWLYE
jgi:hypothetical protein